MAESKQKKLEREGIVDLVLISLGSILIISDYAADEEFSGLGVLGGLVAGAGLSRLIRFE